MEMYQIIIFILLGLTVLLFGYRIKKIAFFIVWFILGFNLVTMLMPTINNLVPQIVGNALWQNLLPIAGGLLLALLGFTIEKLCLAGVCFALTMIQVIVIGAIVGVVLAGLAVTLVKPATIIATSIAGSYALTLAIFALITQFDIHTFYWPVLIGLAVIGAIFQFTTTKHEF